MDDGLTNNPNKIKKCFGIKKIKTNSRYDLYMKYLASDRKTPGGNLFDSNTILMKH